jgi:hypothetical protein
MILSTRTSGHAPVLTALTIPASEVRRGDQLAAIRHDLGTHFPRRAWPVVDGVTVDGQGDVVLQVVNSHGHMWMIVCSPSSAVCVRRYQSEPVAAHHEREAKALTPQRKGNPEPGAGHTAQPDEAATMHVERVTAEHLAWCARRYLDVPDLGSWVIARRREGRLVLVLRERLGYTREALLLQLPTLARYWHARPVGLDDQLYTGRPTP